MAQREKPVTPPSLPQLYLPIDIAKALDCSEWWVKEQARKGRIPYTKPAGSYRFTAEHFAEILRIYESIPTEQGTPASAAAAPRRRVPAAAPSVTQLRARTPRRAQRHQAQATDAA